MNPRRDLSIIDRARHWAHYHRVLGEVLADARSGTLTAGWRQEVHAYAAQLPRLWARTPAPGVDETAGGRVLAEPDRAAALAQLDDESDRLYACAVADTSRCEPAVWDPFAPKGDWLRALDADAGAGAGAGAERGQQADERRGVRASPSRRAPYQIRVVDYSIRTAAPAIV